MIGSEAINRTSALDGIEAAGDGAHPDRRDPVEDGRGVRVPTRGAGQVRPGGQFFAEAFGGLLAARLVRSTHASSPAPFQQVRVLPAAVSRRPVNLRNLSPGV